MSSLKTYKNSKVEKHRKLNCCHQVVHDDQTQARGDECVCVCVCARLRSSERDRASRGICVLIGWELADIFHSEAAQWLAETLPSPPGLPLWYAVQSSWHAAAAISTLYHTRAKLHRVCVCVCVCVSQLHYKHTHTHRAGKSLQDKMMQERESQGYTHTHTV